MAGYRMGYAEIGDSRFAVTGTLLAGGEFRSDIELPPSAEQISGRICLYGGDGELVAVGKTVIIPPHRDTVTFRYGVKIEKILSAAGTQDLSMLPGWGR
jgi:hypothetical protein